MGLRDQGAQRGHPDIRTRRVAFTIGPISRSDDRLDRVGALCRTSTVVWSCTALRSGRGADSPRRSLGPAGRRAEKLAGLVKSRPPPNDNGLQRSGELEYHATVVRTWLEFGGVRLATEALEKAFGRSMLAEEVSIDVLPFFDSDQYDVGLEYPGHIRARHTDRGLAERVGHPRRRPDTDPWPGDRRPAPPGRPAQPLTSPTQAGRTPEGN